LIKDLVFAINKKLKPSVVVIGSQTAGKANLWVMLSAELIEEKGLNAVELIKSISKEIQGGGGGQPFFASAGAKTLKVFREPCMKQENTFWRKYSRNHK
jgi:alanyl-tRNA synthetase